MLAGEKKCKPITLVGSSTTEAISFTFKQLVFEAKIHSLDVNYKRGHLHATTQVKLSLGITDAIDDPLFEAALEMSKDSDLWDIGTAFNVVTINRYIEKKYDV